MHRFYFPSASFAGNYVNSQDHKAINQLSKVLRAKEGDRFVVFDGSGHEYVVQLLSLDRSLAKFLIIDKRKSEAEPSVRLTLYPALLKSDKFEWMIQKATELGASRIIPVITKRCITNSISHAKLQRYREIIREAAEQCGGSVLLEIADAMEMSEALAWSSNESGSKFIAWEGESGKMFASKDCRGDVHVMIGPEGGFEREEVNRAVASGFVSVGFGKRIYRAETAAVYVAALAAQEGQKHSYDD